VKKYAKYIIALFAVLMTLGCSGALGDVSAADPVERGLSYIAAAIVSHAFISLFR